MALVNMKQNWIKFIIAWSLLIGMPVLAAEEAETPAPTEEQVKIAFLYNFVRFVEWPPDALRKTGDSFSIGILGKNVFGQELEQALAGKTIMDKKLVLRRLNSVEEATDCQVVFIGKSEVGKIDSILGSLRGQPVLTVSDIRRFMEQGGMIGFVLDHHRVSFNINQTVAEASRLKISSQLLKLAKTIAHLLQLKSVA